MGSRFCMEVCMDSPNKIQITKSTKELITQPFFELQTQDFAWKFIWTVQPNDKVQKYKKYKSTKIQKYKSTKLQKYKSTKYKTKKYKNTKTKKNAKNVKSTKSTKYKNKKHWSASY